MKAKYPDNGYIVIGVALSHLSVAILYNRISIAMICCLAPPNLSWQYNK